MQHGLRQEGPARDGRFSFSPVSHFVHIVNPVKRFSSLCDQCVIYGQAFSISGSSGFPLRASAAPRETFPRMRLESGVFSV
jgi:hypothetical protein